MSLGLIIYARYDSRRLPGKALKKIVGKELLLRVYERLVRFYDKEKIVVATSTRDNDILICDFCRDQGINYFQGSDNDLIQRTVDCCAEFGFSRIARINGDRPLFDPKLIFEYDEQLVLGGYDFVTNKGPDFITIPGLVTEIFTLQSLQRILELDTSDEEKEHLTLWYYLNNQKVKTRMLRPENHLEKIAFTVDTQNDISKIEYIIRNLKNPSVFDLDELISLHNKWDL